MSRVFAVTVTEIVGDPTCVDGAEDGMLVSEECAANVLRCMADDISVYERLSRNLVHPDD